MEEDLTHYLCCLSHKGKRLPVFGNFSSNKKIDMLGAYNIFIKKGDYDGLRKSLKDLIEPEILNSAVEMDNKMVSLSLPGCYYTYLASMRKPEKTKLSETPLIEEPKSTISDRAKQFWKILGGKRRTAKLVPSGYRNVIYRNL